MSFLRKQQCRLLCACSGVPAGPAGTLRYLLDSRLRGNNNPGGSHPAFPAGGEASCCFIRLKYYGQRLLVEEADQLLASAGLLEFSDGFGLNLANTFPGHPEDMADLFQGVAISVAQAVPKL